MRFNRCMETLLATKTGQVKFITSPSLFHTLPMEKAAVEEAAAAT